MFNMTLLPIRVFVTVNVKNRSYKNLMRHTNESIIGKLVCSNDSDLLFSDGLIRKIARMRKDLGYPHVSLNRRFSKS